MRKAAFSRRLHHAWLITGIEGVGKATLAYRFARALLAGFPEDGLDVLETDRTFREVANGLHPDLVVISLGWNNKKHRANSEILRVDVRELFDLLFLTPAAGGWRVVVIDGIDDLNINAVNSLLKLLEEPPPRVTFLLTSPMPNLLPITILSRCIRLALRPLDQTHMSRFVARFLGDLGEERNIRLIKAAQGSPGKALRLHADITEDNAPDEEVPGRPQALRPSLDMIGRLPDDVREAASLIVADRLQIGLHQRVRSETAGAHDGPDHDARLSVLRMCDNWSTIGRMRSATERSNLDRLQLTMDVIRSL